MLIENILKKKGVEVATLTPESKVKDAVRMLAERRIGALVISPDGERIAGILSERDVVRALDSADADKLLNQPVSTLMSVNVVTCERGATLDELMIQMSERRIRHLPVVEDGRLVGIVSIGDVVQSRINQLERERSEMEAYIHQ